MNSAEGLTYFRMSHGHATRSTFAPCRGIHLPVMRGQAELCLTRLRPCGDLRSKLEGDDLVDALDELLLFALRDRGAGGHVVPAAAPPDGCGRLAERSCQIHAPRDERLGA